MSWQHWIVVILFVLSAATQSLRVGKPTKSITGNQAAYLAISQLILAALIWWGA